MERDLFTTSFGDKKPILDPDAFVDISARIIGDVNVEDGASIWPMAVLRADSDSITVERFSAVLDLALLEAPRGHPVRIREKSIVSHGSIIHGAEIQSHVLIGIGAIILEDVVISRGSIIGAGSVVTSGTRIPANSLVLGVPARVVRQTTVEERSKISEQIEELRQKSLAMKAQLMLSSGERPK
jgi:carbonic anhydrase/acetyltransferase-like protein (isoleucine patch superfamily)